MRIISGKYKGRRLHSFEAGHLRPTTDRVKESIFNILQGYFEGARVCDLFSGTGNLSFEALSRGASSVLSVEKHPQSLQIHRKNQELLQTGTELKLERDDVFKFLKTYQAAPFDVVFIDPPFTEKIGDKVMEAVTESKLFHPQTVIVIESSKHETMKDDYGLLILFDRRNFGDKLVSFFKPKDNQA